jgi:hypothetical protein
LPLLELEVGLADAELPTEAVHRQLAGVIEARRWHDNLGSERDRNFVSEPDPNLNGRMMPTDGRPARGCGPARSARRRASRDRHIVREIERQVAERKEIVELRQRLTLERRSAAARMFAIRSSLQTTPATIASFGRMRLASERNAVGQSPARSIGSAARDRRRCPVWDHSNFSKNRDRLLDGEIAALFSPSRADRIWRGPWGFWHFRRSMRG